MSVLADKRPGNRTAAHWARKVENRRTRKAGILDTGATSGAAPEEDEEYFEDSGQLSSKTFMLPDRRTHRATKKMLLRHPLREIAREVNIVPGLHSTLVSVPKLADADYITVFDKTKAIIYDATTTNVKATEPPVLTAHRCHETGLWKLPLDPNQPTDNINAIFDLPSTKKTLLWYHAAAGFPPEETFIEAVRAGNYSTWPGLTVNMVHRHFPDSIETSKGHLKGQRQGIRSTKQKALEKLVEMAAVTIKQEFDDSPPTTPLRHNDIFIYISDPSETIHSDQTGGFPYTSQRGNRYIMVAIHLDANYIFVEPMKNRTEGQMMAAYQRIINRMRAAGLGLKLHILDNECSAAFKQLIATNNMTHELVPPGNHRRNQAERAIQTFKAHFISILAGVDDKFPLSLWCHLLEPAELTLNLLRQSKSTPKISAFAQVHGHHDYMKKPFAPLGCAVQVHVKPDDRHTWDARADSGFNLGTSMEHHRCYRVYITKTRATRVSDTVAFQHQYITNPSVSPESRVIAAAQQLTAALKGSIPTGNETEEALTKVSELFTRIAAAKKTAAAAREQRNRLRTHPTARNPTQLPRVAAPLPRVAEPAPRVAIAPQVDCHVTPSPDDCRVGRDFVASRRTPPPNYISQDEDDTPPQPRYATRANTRSIMQEAMLSCIDLTNPKFTVTPEQMSRRKLPMAWFCEMANSVIGANGELLEYRDLIRNPATRKTWTHSYGNELGRLAQGMPGRNTGTNTVIFIPRDAVPKDRARDVTYGLITVLIRPEKVDEPNRTRLVAGGDRVHYPGDAGTPTADLLTVKLLINSIVSTPGAKFFTLDIKDFYLNTPMTRFEYMRLKLSDIPEDVIDHYQLRKIATPDGFVYCEIQKGMYGLPQAGIIAQELLAERLAKHGYHQSKTTPGLWTHDTRPIWFSLVVDDFGVKYVGEEHAQHLLNVVQKYYKCSCDWAGERYCGLTLKWDYTGRKVHLTMPNYVSKALTRFQHPPPNKPQDQPYPHVKPNYGAKKQYARPDDDSPPLNKAGKKFVQEVCGVFLFLARGIDGGILPALSALASQQANPTERTMELCKNFLDYMATQEEAILTYKASKMVLAIHSDASYLSEANARSRAGGHMFMATDEDIPQNNGAVLNISQIIRAVLSSAAEAELGALFINAKTAVSLRQTLEELGHPQPRTPMQTDNATAHALLTNKILPKALKAMDMRFHWLRDRAAQKQYRFYWRPGTQNLADYFTKHHPASHHKSFRSQILTSPSDPEYTKLLTPKATSTKSFVTNLLATPRFQVSSNPATYAAACA